MKLRRAASTSILAAVLLLGLSGCGWGVSHGMSGFAVGETRGEICTRNNQVALVIWIDDRTTGASSGAGGDPPFYGEFRLRDGRKIAWSAATRDGKTGQVTIAGSAYDLEKGGLLLIRTKGGGAQVEQLPLEMLGMGQAPGASEKAQAKLKELAKTDQKIAVFVKAKVKDILP